MRRGSLIIAFSLGACATAAVQSTAMTPASSSNGTTAGRAPEQAVSAAAIVPKEAAPRRAAPNGKATIFMLSRGRNAFLGKLEMDAGAAVPEHRDPTEEYIHVLEGAGIITIDGTRHEIGPGTTVYMPANAVVSFQNGKTPMVAMQVFAGPEPASKYDAWTPVDSTASSPTPGSPP